MFTSVVNNQVTRSKDNDNFYALKTIFVTDIKVSLKDEDVDILFAVLDVAPKFETCKDSVEQAAKNCFFLKINEHIVKNFKYPKES